MAGVAGLEPVTSAVTGQRSNQLSYTPARGDAKLTETLVLRQDEENKKIRIADAKEVGVGNPAEETYCYPNTLILGPSWSLSIGYHPHFRPILTQFWRCKPRGSRLGFVFPARCQRPAGANG
jgi:hypothetical protein